VFIILDLISVPVGIEVFLFGSALETLSELEGLGICYCVLLTLDGIDAQMSAP
jgi:hypothetical protein